MKERRAGKRPGSKMRVDLRRWSSLGRKSKKRQGKMKKQGKKTWMTTVADHTMTIETGVADSRKDKLYIGRKSNISRSNMNHQMVEKGDLPNHSKKRARDTIRKETHCILIRQVRLW